MRILNTSNYTPLFSFFFLIISTLSAQDDTDQTSNQNTFVQANTYSQPEASVTINQDPKIKMLLDIKSKMEKDGEFSDRYKIQLYYGSLNKANEIVRASKEAFPDWDSSIQWETPNYKVWIGNYRTRLEADRALKEAHTKFPNAFIFKPEKK
ncbi:SPOR domain-containing protein [Aquimarina aquimarini]|uniref:SPOR domain-containing protein n=1 Tax=Aquimarina aquimarini TaxID=1191734 RepID=UPI000D55F2E5|nr:SPOR domain-containing protein [Aquimarina aquimarini]